MSYDRIYRWCERPMLVLATACYLAYFPLALADGTTLRGALLGAVLWLAQGALLAYMWRRTARRTRRRQDSVRRADRVSHKGGRSAS